MRTLSLLIFFIYSISYAQSPHGDAFNLDCQVCHTVEGWNVLISKMAFSHDQTEFELKGQHKTLQCKSCHVSLVFSEKKRKNNCENCHSCKYGWQ